MNNLLNEYKIGVQFTDVSGTEYLELLSNRDEIAEIKQIIQELYQEQLDKIILFGSRARGDNRPDSDFDLLIILKNDFNYSQEIEKTSHFISKISLKFDLVFSRIFATSDEFLNKNTPFFLNVRREGIIL